MQVVAGRLPGQALVALNCDGPGMQRNSVELRSQAECFLRNRFARYRQSRGLRGGSDDRDPERLNDLAQSMAM